MLNLGTVRPGSTIRVPFSSFDKDDGSSITMTNYAAADILVYKDGSTTERASTSGFTATTDFDGKTGKHLAVIDLSDNTTADFWAAGSEYLVAIDAVTIDGVTTGGWIARFTIGYPNANLDTTIATLSSQTSFTLASGPAEDDAINGHMAIIHDAASAVQRATVLVLDYTGSTKTVTLAAAPTFTIAAKDNFSLMDLAPIQPTVLGRTLDVSTGGEAGVDWANIGSPTTSVNLSGTTVKTATDVETDTQDIQSRLPAALVSGRIDASVGAMAANTLTASALATDAVTEIQTGLATSAALATVQADTDDIQSRLPAALTGAGNMKCDALAISGDATAADNAESFFDGTGYAGTNNVIPSVTTVGTVNALANNSVTAAALAADAGTEIGTAVWATTTRELTAFDEDNTTIDVDATVRAAVGLASANLDTQLGAIKTDTAAIKLKTDNLPSDPADASDIASAFGTVNATLSTIAGYVDTEVASIKAVTDKLDNTLENTSDGYIFTANALQQAPSSSGPTAAAIADAVWEEAIADHSGTSGSTAEALAAAGAAGDPWATSLPGAYSAGQAGKIVGDNLNATVSSRATQTSVDDLPTNAELATALGTADDAVLAQVALVKAKTDNLPSDPADASDIAGAFSTVNTKLDTIDDFLDTEIAAIKAKTDNLPASPAATGDIPTAAENATATWDEAVDGATTARESMAIQNSAAAGEVSGQDLLSPVFRDLANTKDRITGDLDSFGNRTNVVTDGT